MALEFLRMSKRSGEAEYSTCTTEDGSEAKVVLLCSSTSSAGSCSTEGPEEDRVYSLDQPVREAAYEASSVCHGFLD